MRIKDSHLYLSGMNRICYCYTKPPAYRLDRIRTCDNSIEKARSYHLTTNPIQPSASIALASIDYKTIALLLC